MKTNFTKDEIDIMYINIIQYQKNIHYDLLKLYSEFNKTIKRFRWNKKPIKHFENDDIFKECSSTEIDIFGYIVEFKYSKSKNELSMFIFSNKQPGKISNNFFRNTLFIEYYNNVNELKQNYIENIIRNIPEYNEWVERKKKLKNIINDDDDDE